MPKRIGGKWCKIEQTGAKTDEQLETISKKKIVISCKKIFAKN
jgi:hypothetical protein